MSKGHRISLLLLLLTVVTAASFAQTSKRKPKYDPVQWSLEIQPATAAPGERAVARLTATIEEGWRLYAPTTPKGGPIPTELTLTDSPAVESWKVYQPEPKTKFDENFGAETQTYHDEAVFLFDISLAANAALGTVGLEANTRYSACDDRLCLPPVRKTASASFTIAANSSEQAAAIPGGYMEAKPAVEVAAVTAARGASAPSPPVVPSQNKEGFIQFAAVAFGFGLLAIFTPCVFPMIPITMSYFVSTHTGSRRQSVIQAITFCAGVIILFTSIGAAVAALAGPFGLSQLGSSVPVNLLITAVFIAFGLSLLGVFEITVPSGALTSLNKVSNRGGLLGTLVMGLVFALASFACTGPFIGALLAGSIQGDLSWPIFGMLMFSSGLALPFFFLALFPAYLSRMPKSGGWLVRTKITMSFLIFAAALKYLSNVDQVYQWHFLTRERYLAVWIVLLAMAGFYLFGMLRIGDDEESGSVGPARLGLGGLFFVLAVSLIPGMFGARLGELDAYVPPPEYSGLTNAGFGGAAGAGKWIKGDYAKALELAQESGKPVLISFTGYTCTNCHWMKANMFTRPSIAEALDGLVLLELYTDGADDGSEANQQMQLDRFGTVAIPYYAIIRPDESVLAEFAGRTRNTEEFLQFLTSGRTTQLAGAGGRAAAP